jgi:hypothetical protein
MVVNAAGGLHADATIAATVADRAAVLESPLAHRAFAIVDAIWLGDERIAELRTT